MKTCLVVIDGWGIDPNKQGNAVLNANTPCMTKLSKEYPYMTLSASGLDVGLPEGLMGNSEVGHLNIGAGRVVYQDIVRIELAIKKETLCLEDAVVAAFDRAKQGNGRLHLLGLLSDGGVHSHINHLLALLKGAKDAKVPHTFIQAFGDGRDTAPKSANGYLKTLLEYIQHIKYGELASFTGRYYAMDRDKRWERIKVAYEGLVQGIGEQSSDVLLCLEERYGKGETDGRLGSKQ
jgi:2,3-bisphosphoglycerate-independent phosphoglycerate mutase